MSDKLKQDCRDFLASIEMLGLDSAPRVARAKDLIIRQSEVIEERETELKEMQEKIARLQQILKPFVDGMTEVLDKE